MSRLLVCWGAGSLGAFVNTLLAHLASETGLLAALGSRVMVPFAPPSLYTRLVWGGLWGLLLALPPLAKERWIRAGLLVSLAPTAAQLLYFFPNAGKGWLGVELGWGTPVAALFFNAVWGLVAARAASSR